MRPKFRSGVPDRPIGVRSVRSGTTKLQKAPFLRAQKNSSKLSTALSHCAPLVASLQLAARMAIFELSAPQRCNAQRSDAQRKFFTTLSISLFLQRHRCDALPCFSASPVEIFYIAHIALRPLLPFFLSQQWFTVQNNKKFAKSHNAAMSPLATRDGQRNAQRTTQRCGALRLFSRTRENASSKANFKDKLRL